MRAHTIGKGSCRGKKSLAILAMALGMAVSTGAMAARTASSPTSNLGIIPYIITGDNPGGNRTCTEVGQEFFGNAAYYQCYSGRANYDKDNDNFDITLADVSGNANCSNTVGVTVTNDTFVTWTSTSGVGAAIVKGSNDANVYVYDPQKLGDSGLASPPNASGDPSGLSNLTFCWNPPPPDGKCYEDETAWASGYRYVTRGNWATYTSYSGVEKTKTVTLYAGQTMAAGTVSFSAPSAGVVTITITLNAGWRFALEPVGDTEGEYDNNVKVQDYATAPTGSNPAPGLFAWKKVATESPATIEVPVNNFYGVHVDVEREVPCPPIQ